MPIFERAKQLVAHEWQAIDDEYRDRPAFDRRPIAVLLVCAVVNVVLKYLGSTKSLPDALGSFVQRHLEHPTLYPYLWWSLSRVVCYLVVPALFIRFYLKERIGDYGLVPPERSARSKRNIRLLYATLCLLVIGAAYVMSFTKPFLHTYPRYPDAGDSLTQFFVWEAAYAVQFFVLEFFFRGFMLFSLARYMGPLSIFVMAIPYSMIHFEKPFVEALGAIVTGTVLGTLALRTRSIYAGAIVHVGVAVSMDVFAMMQKGSLGRLF